jgi:hypothetical protein
MCDHDYQIQVMIARQYVLAVCNYCGDELEQVS